MRASNVVSALVAAFVGFGGTVALVVGAAESVGASPGPVTSWVTAVCLGTGASSLLLSVRLRMPIIAAWSTPGAALVAGSATVDLHLAVGAFLVSGALLTATGLVPRLGELVGRVPVELAAAMLAGVLVGFVLRGVGRAEDAPRLVLPLVGLFLLVRAVRPAYAVVAVLLTGVPLAAAIGYDLVWPEAPTLSRLTWVQPDLSVGAVVGLGLPLYLVTMASQNLPGLAVLRSFGYVPPPRPLLVTTGVASLLTAPFGAHATNLAAITAAIAAGEESHPDPDARWLTGVVYGVVYLVVAAFAGLLVALLTVLPESLTQLVIALALVSPLTGALASAMSREDRRFAAVATFAVTASGVTLLSVGSAFWGLTAGLLVLAIERASATARPAGSARR